jgi:phage major head subunit gpT-like protein
MDINRQNMDALFQTYNAAFTAGMQSAAGRPTPEDVLVTDFALVAPGSGAATVYAWLNQISGMREWLGDRVIGNIETGKLTVTNRDFEKTIGVKRNDILDDQVGVYMPLITNMGFVGESIWGKLGSDALLANGVWADGKAFFAADRKYGDQDIVNIGTDALSDVTFKAAKVKMESFMLHGGEPGEVVCKTLMVGPSLRETGWNIVKNEYVSSGTGKGGSIKNPNLGACELRINRRWVGANANKWALLGEQGGMKSVYVQQREKARLTRLDRDTDENVFMRNMFYYGTNCRGEAFLTLPHLAFLGNVAA